MNITKLWLLLLMPSVYCYTFARMRENNGNEPEATNAPPPNGRSFFLIGAILRRVRDRWLGYNEPVYAGSAFPLGGYYAYRPAPQYVQQQTNPYYYAAAPQQYPPQQSISPQYPQQQQQQQQQSSVVIYQNGQHGQYAQPYYTQQGVQTAQAIPMPANAPIAPATAVVYNSGGNLPPQQYGVAAVGLPAQPYPPPQSLPPQPLPQPPPFVPPQAMPQGVPLMPGPMPNCGNPYPCPIGG